MTTSLADSARHEDWAEASAKPIREPLFDRAEWLWTLVGLALLGAFLSLLVEDLPLRTVIPGL